MVCTPVVCAYDLIAVNTFAFLFMGAFPLLGRAIPQGRAKIVHAPVV